MQLLHLSSWGPEPSWESCGSDQEVPRRLLYSPLWAPRGICGHRGPRICGSAVLSLHDLGTVLALLLSLQHTPQKRPKSCSSIFHNKGCFPPHTQGRTTGRNILESDRASLPIKLLTSYFRHLRSKRAGQKQRLRSC